MNKMNYNIRHGENHVNGAKTSPCQRGKGGRKFDPTEHAPTLSEFETMVAWIAKKIGECSGLNRLIWRRNFAIILLLRHTALRIHSLTQIRIVDAKAAVKSGWLVIPAKNMKNGNKNGVANPRYEHHVCLSTEARKTLKVALSVRGAMFRICDENEMLFVGRDYESNGKGITDRTVQLFFNQVCEAVQIHTHVTPHKMRAFFSMMAGLAEKVMPRFRVLPALQKMLHHASIVTTMNDYAKAGAEDLIKFCEAVSQDTERLRHLIDEQLAIG